LYKASLLFKTRKKPSIENYATTLVEGCDRTFSVLWQEIDSGSVSRIVKPSQSCSSVNMLRRSLYHHIHLSNH